MRLYRRHIPRYTVPWLAVSYLTNTTRAGCSVRCHARTFARRLRVPCSPLPYVVLKDHVQRAYCCPHTYHSVRDPSACLARIYLLW